MNRILKQNTAKTIVIGQLFDYSDSKTLLYDALGGNDNFDPTKLKCTIFKNTTSSVITLSKMGGSNNINLVAGGMATLELTAGNVDTVGDFTITFENATEGQEIIFPVKFEFTVAPNTVDELVSGVDFIKAVTEGDAEVDIAASPWQLVIKHKTTGAELIRKDLFDITGQPIADVATVIAQHREAS